MDPNSLISPDELRESIPTNIVYGWALGLIKRFGSSNENKEFIRLKIGVAQELIDEIYPLSIYANAFYDDPQVFMKYYPGCNNSFDAEFVDDTGKVIERVEVTMAIDGQQSRIQNEALNIFGHTSVFHVPRFKGNVSNRIISEPECLTISSDEIIRMQLKLLMNAYTKKHKNLKKYPGTTLLIGMEIPSLMESECQKIIDGFVPQSNTFNRIACVNTISNEAWRLKS